MKDIYVYTNIRILYTYRHRNYIGVYYVHVKTTDDVSTLLTPCVSNSLNYFPVSRSIHRLDEWHDPLDRGIR